MTLSLTWEGIAIAVSHTPGWLNSAYDHIELRADQKLPVTETGYRSRFILTEDLARFADLETFVRQWLDDAAASADWQRHLKDSQQLLLF